ncbi:Per1p [Sporobolomyces salmoneus]|uniref:Per1p n=1 Tax=Sporobolomyces salmoneus TaxID=183962 RepID=UPI0031750B1F
MSDRSRPYQSCLTSCITSNRDNLSSTPPVHSSSSFPPSSFSQYHSSPLWSCRSTCSYACQQLLTDLALSLPRDADSTSIPSNLEGLPLGRQVQFHGKWPFHRLDFSHLPFPFYLIDYFLPRTQEPLSVLFSLVNLYAHYEGFKSLRTLSRSGEGGARTIEGRNLARTYLIYSISGLNAWISSSIFHTRDTAWTERLDYFGAGLTTLCGLWICIVRILGWYTSPPSPSSKRFKPLLNLSFSILYLLHISYLSLRDRFNYSYNMKINIFLSLVTISLWLYWIFLQSTLPTPSNFSRRQLSSYPSARTRFRAPHHLDPLLPLLLLPTLTLLEVLDFAPVGFGTGLRLLDSHALWHLSTVMVVKWWYRFLTRDVRWVDGAGDPLTAQNALKDRGSSSSTTGTGRDLVGGGGGLKGMEWRRGNLKEGMVGFGLGVLDKYGLGLGTNGRKSRPTTTTSQSDTTPDGGGGASSRID